LADHKGRAITFFPLELFKKEKTSSNKNQVNMQFREDMGFFNSLFKKISTGVFLN